jgi:hypothetical protein
MEILGFAVEYIGMSQRFVGRKKDISGYFGGRTTACKFPSLVHGNIHDDFLQFAGGTGRENRINRVEGKFAGFGIGKLRQNFGFILTGTKSEGDERIDLDGCAIGDRSFELPLFHLSGQRPRRYGRS